MKIKFTKSYSYRITDETLKKLKEKILERYEENFEEYESNVRIFSIDEIPDEVVKKCILAYIDEMDVFQDNDCAFVFDDYFETMSLNFYGDDLPHLIDDIIQVLISD